MEKTEYFARRCKILEGQLSETDRKVQTILKTLTAEFFGATAPIDWRVQIETSLST